MRKRDSGRSSGRKNWQRLLGGMALWLGACAPRPYYEVPVLPPGFLIQVDDAATRRQLLTELPDRLTAGRLRQIEFTSQTTKVAIELSPAKGPEGGPVPPLGQLTTPALAAIYLAADFKTRGAQWNLLVHQASAQDIDVQVPVQVLHEPDGTLKVHQGLARSSYLAKPRHPPTADDLRQSYGIAPSEGGLEWSAPYYAALDQALALLSREELAFLARIPIAREHAMAEAETEHRTQARYLRVGGQARIELYDLMVATDDTTFCGTVDAPRPSSVCVLLHEIGHALADTSNTSALDDLATARSSLQADLEPLRQRVSQQGPDAPVSAGEVNSLVHGVERLYATHERVQHLGKRGPVLGQYRWARSVRKGPTPYGATDLAESFAEAFALFRSDPEALLRIDPGAHAFFLHERHLHALSD